MAKKSMAPASRERLALTVPFEEARAKVYRQLERGSQILERAINNEDELDRAEKDYSRWLDYTAEMLAHVATTNDLSQQLTGFSFGSSGGSHSLSQEIEWYRDRVAYKLNVLASIYEKLEIYDVVGQKAATSEGSAVIREVADRGAPSITIINHGTITNPQIQQGTNQSSQVGGATQIYQAQINELVQELRSAVDDVAGKVDEGVARQLRQDSEALIYEIVSETPRRRWWELSAEGLQQAAEKIGAIATPILNVVNQMLPILVAISQAG